MAIIYHFVSEGLIPFQIMMCYSTMKINGHVSINNKKLDFFLICIFQLRIDIMLSSSILDEGIVNICQMTRKNKVGKIKK